MKLINVEDIIIGEDRQRNDMFSKEVSEHIENLANELRSPVGLLQPIVLRSDESPVLVAGECRTTAIKLLSQLGIGIMFDGERLPPSMVPYSVMGDLSEVEYEEAELSENLSRVNLTWQQQATAVARLHKLREKQHGTYGVGAKPREGQSMADTAREVHKVVEPTTTQVAEVKAAVAVIDHLHDPDVAKAKSEKEAVKIIERKKKEQHRIELAEEYIPEDSPHDLFEGDCRDYLKTISDGSVDVIVTDPPYGIEMGKSWDGDSHDYDDSIGTFMELFDALPSELYRVAADRSHCYLFCDLSNWAMLRTRMEAAGWLVWSRPIIWYKGNSGAYPNSERGYRYTYECILFANKGKRETNGLPHDVIANIPQIQNQDHPAGKPSRLYGHLLSISALPGDTVLDVFAGSGPIFPAATENHCKALACELNPKYHALAKLRMGNTYDDE